MKFSRYIEKGEIIENIKGNIPWKKKFIDKKTEFFFSSIT